MTQLTDYKVKNTGNVIDIKSKPVTIEGRKIQHSMSFHDTQKGFNLILTQVKNPSNWVIG